MDNKKLEAIRKSDKVIYDTMRENRKRKVEAIVEMLTEHNGAISFSYEGENDDYDLPQIDYDGGGHPEYASALYQDVYEVHLSGKSFAAEMDNDDDYGEDRMPYADVSTIYDALVGKLTDCKDETESL